MEGINKFPPHVVGIGLSENTIRKIYRLRILPRTPVIDVEIEAHITVIEPFLAYEYRLFHFDFFLLSSHFSICVIFFFDLLLYCLSTIYAQCKDNSRRDKNGTKQAFLYPKLGKYNNAVKNRPCVITNCKSVRFTPFCLISFYMVLPACNNWWLIGNCSDVPKGVKTSQ